MPPQQVPQPVSTLSPGLPRRKLPCEVLPVDQSPRVRAMLRIIVGRHSHCASSASQLCGLRPATPPDFPSQALSMTRRYVAVTERNETAEGASISVFNVRTMSKRRSMVAGRQAATSYCAIRSSSNPARDPATQASR